MLAGPRTQIVLRLVEVEAYLGPGEDEASHAHNGQTPRNAEMFETPGHLYVYFTYGMHHCMNVVTESKGRAGAVLLRAGEVLVGEEVMRSRRLKGGRELANGPAKLCQAVGVDLSWNGLDLVRDRLGIWPWDTRTEVAVSSRIGIRRAVRSPYRFFDPSSPCVSRAKPAFDVARGC